MSIFKRGNVYWYHFLFNGKHIQKSTKQGNPRTARQIEAAYETALAKGEVGITERKKAPGFTKHRRRTWHYLRKDSYVLWRSPAQHAPTIR
jgi:hypothetical protein